MFLRRKTDQPIVKTAFKTINSITLKFYLFILAFCPLWSFAQNYKTDDLNPENLGTQEIVLEAQRIAPSELKFPFSKIRIIDSRFDTSKIGFSRNLGFLTTKKTFFRKLVLKGGASKAIEGYYNDYYNRSFTQNGFELLIVMKRFWASCMNNARSKRVELTSKITMDKYLYCKWEYYLGRNGEYIPVKRIDTVMEENEDVRLKLREGFGERRSSLLKFQLKAMIEVFSFEQAVLKFDQMKKMSIEEINTYNAKRNQLPILQSNSFAKGVYMSYDEFKNNSPSIVDFKESKMRYGLFNKENYLENNKGEIISDFWGYSDGEKFRYGALGSEKIYRRENAFEFFSKAKNILYSDDEGEPKSYKEVWIPFQIDMETGLIY
jgi:hypothetical protein